jgi:hypothetical protein
LATTNDITISPKQSNQRHDMHSGYQSSARLKGQRSSNSAFISQRLVNPINSPGRVARVDLQAQMKEGLREAIRSSQHPA